MARILVTGASGFVGAQSAARLAAEGHAVAVLARDPAAPRLKALPPPVRRIQGDLARPEGWKDALLDFAPDALVHAAWGGVHGSDRAGAGQADNVAQSAHLLDLAAAAGVRRVVAFGSQAEYGPHVGPLSEEAETRPASVYGAAKLASLILLSRLAAQRGVSLAWLRLFSCYGPGDDPRWMLQSVIRQLLRGERPQLTACEQRWDYLYIDDVGAAVAAVLRAGVSGVFNLGSGEAPRLRDTVELVRDLVNPALPLAFGALPYGPDQVMHLQADISKLKAATGWRPTVPLAEGLARNLAAVRAETGL